MGGTCVTEWAAKRFWTDVTVTGGGAGYGIALDGREVRTPSKASLIVPTHALAAAIAAEWAAVEEKIDPRAMPMTRSANAAIDKVAHQHDEVATMIAAYGETDLLCYRAASPQELVLRQSEEWDPLLDWAAAHLGVRLKPVTGIMPKPQDPVALARLQALVHAHGSFALTGLHDLVALSGSLIIGLAAAQDARPIRELWQVSRLDEAWQAELWGADEDAEAMAAIKRAAFVHARRFYKAAIDTS